MNVEPMRSFLSEANIKRHLEHLRQTKLRYSIMEKSLPQLCGKTICELVRLNIDRDAKDEAISLLFYIKAHECFFDSFADRQGIAGEQGGYPAREKFLYDLYSEAIKRDHCFLFIFRDRHGSYKWTFSDGDDGAFIRYEPLLAIDLYEHSYFLDYGFEKKMYLRNALAYLRLSALDNRDGKGYNKV